MTDPTARNLVDAIGRLEGALAAHPGAVDAGAANQGARLRRGHRRAAFTLGRLIAPAGAPVPADISDACEGVADRLRTAGYGTFGDA